MNITPRSHSRFCTTFCEIKTTPLITSAVRVQFIEPIYIYYNHLARYTGRMPASLRSCSNTMNVTTVCGPMRSQLGTKPL